MKLHIDRGSVVITAILVGLIVGLFAGTYVFVAVIPTESILNSASPGYLTSDAVLLSPQYREFYVVRAAEKYQRDQQVGLPDPLRGALDVLGVTTGDTTIDDAVSMVRFAEKVAQRENNSDGDAGMFTRNEELAMGTLANAIDQARQLGNYPKIDYSQYAPMQRKTLYRIAGALGLILLLVAGGALIVWMDHRKQAVSGLSAIGSINRESESEQPQDPPSTAPTPLAISSSAQVGRVATVNLSPTSPGVPTSIFAPPVSRQSSTLIAPDSPIATFAPTVYRHGDDRYDEDFAINGQMGELLGECGASIADRIGLDNPSRVSALSLWVFDKNDFQSTTKVLMTEYAYHDSVTRSKLRIRGDAVQAIEGGVIEILTSTMRVEIQVSDLAHNADKNPDRGYFQNVTLTFRVFRRLTAV